MRILLVLLFMGTLKTDSYFDFRKSSPLDLLEFLSVKHDMNFFIINPDSVPNNWLRIEDCINLINKLESKRITTPVFSINSSVDMKYKIRTTEGVEALFMIESLRKNKKYPSELSSANFGVLKNGVLFPDTNLTNEVKLWFKTTKTRQNSNKNVDH